MRGQNGAAGGPPPCAQQYRLSTVPCHKVTRSHLFDPIGVEGLPPLKISKILRSSRGGRAQDAV